MVNSRNGAKKTPKIECYGSPFFEVPFFSASGPLGNDPLTPPERSKRTLGSPRGLSGCFGQLQGLILEPPTPIFLVFWTYFRRLFMLFSVPRNNAVFYLWGCFEATQLLTVELRSCIFLRVLIRLSPGGGSAMQPPNASFQGAAVNRRRRCQ